LGVAHLSQSEVWLAVATALCAGAPAQAQITTDGTLGAVQAFTGLHSTIPASLGKQAGGNLFHSFGLFNVPTAGSTTFAGPGAGSPQVSNVISRVSGAQASSIDGRLASSIQGANLFLINPRGILFGPNASLDLTGSFHASTANYLKLADGTRFEATATANPVLTSAPPAAFGFLGPTGEVSLQGTRFDLQAGRGLSIAGGAVNLGGAFLRTRAADLRLAAVTAGEIPVDAAAAPAAGSVMGDVNAAFSQVRTLSSGALPPGRLVIRGGQLATADSVVFSNNFSATAAPPVELVAAGDVALSGTQLLAFAQGPGRGADLVVRGENVTIDRSGLVQAATAFSSGRAGDIDLGARGALRVVAAPTDPGFTTVGGVTEGPGDGGVVRLQGDTVSVEAAIVTSRTIDSGRAGPILIDAREVRFVDGAYVSSEALTGSTGAGGAIQVRATDRFVAAGQDAFGFPTYMVTKTVGAGDGGAISVEARDVLVSGAFIDSVGRAAGKAGAVTLDAETIRLEARDPYIGSITSFTAGSGEAGPLTLRASRSLTMDGKGVNWLNGSFGPTQVVTQTVGPGRGANILVESPLIVLDHDAGIATLGLGAGDVGNILIRTHDLTLVRGQIESSRDAPATGRSGSIRIEGTGRLTVGSLSPLDPALSLGQQPISRIFTTDSMPSATGDIAIDMAEVHVGHRSSIATSGNGLGNSGAITINADRMKLAAGFIASDTLLGTLTPTDRPSAGGSIVLNARESIEMTTLLKTEGGFNGGVSSVTTANGAAGDIFITAPRILLDEVFVQASTTGAGQGGRIVVRANDLVMRRGAQILSGSETSGAAGAIDIDVAGRFEISGVRAVDGLAATLFTVTRGIGQGGNILVRAGDFVLDDRAIVTSSTEGVANSGSINISARTVQLANGATIRARSTGAGNAGTIRIAATDALRIFGGSSIGSEALSSDGGDIDIRVGNLVHLKGSEITTSVGSGAGAGGNIFIDPTFVILEDGSRIVANAFGGPGGKIQIFATYFLNTLDSLVDASSQLGVQGIVQISAPNTNLSTQIKVLPAAFFDASALVREACSGRYASGAPRSSLVGVGRGGLAASPERFATSTYFGNEPPRVSSGPPSTGLRPLAARRARLADDCTG
jgi:filamentous hemagglutinin family protein